MIVLLLMSVLRSLLGRPMRLAGSYLAFMVLLAVPDLLLRRFIDPDLPRPALLALLAILAAAGLFLRASWRRRAGFRVTLKRRSFALLIALLRGADGRSTRTAVILDKYRRPGGP